MQRHLAWLWALLLAPCWGADLTADEQRWLKGAWPVLQHARDSALPLDIIVQPRDARDLPPIGLAFIDGRCKLVFSMRGNPAVQATEQRLPPELFDAALQLMAAHELGHCRRFLDGNWRGLPAGFVQPEPEPSASGDAAARAEMQAERREEGYADLVGLAWVLRHHAPLYGRVHAWLLAERAHERVPGSPHDTLAWLTLARDGARLEQPASMFEAAAAVWKAGLADAAAAAAR